MFKYLAAAGIVAMMAMPVQATSITDRFSAFYVFGDSLSDDGKFTQLPATPPSVGGRFSNGEVWAEHVARTFDEAGRDTGNLAVGGATATDLATLTPISTFNGQIDAFLGSIFGNVGLPTKLAPAPTFAENAPAPGDNPLIAVWLGANDLFASFADADVDAAAQAVADGITRLATSGLGNFDDFLVLNLPDLGATPAYTTLLALTGSTPEEIGAASQAATDATDRFNLQLKTNLELLEDNLGLNIIDFDTNALVNKVIENPADFPFASVTQPCTVSLNEEVNPFVCSEAEADALLFTDAVHPNRIAHQIVANEIQAVVAAVPLPATFWLVLLGLGGLVTMRRIRG